MKLAALAALMLACLPAQAHEAPSGWEYPPGCCGGNDCREIPASSVTENGLGFTVQLDGESFFVQRSLARPSPDGRFHACRYNKQTFLRCFFYPPRETRQRGRLLAGAIIMSSPPEVACTVTDPKTIASLCDLRCTYRGITPVCWWVAKPGAQT